MMNTIHRWMTCIFITIVLLVMAALMDGPDEVEAAQDVADNAALIACREMRGPDAQVFILDGHHLVCRDAVKTAGVEK